MSQTPSPHDNMNIQKTLPVDSKGAAIDELTKHMVDRFLQWKLPEDFHPDAGISFKPIYNEQAPWGAQRHEPVGTNLFTATQATEMVKYMLDDAILALLAQEVKQARIDELERFNNKLGGWAESHTNNYLEDRLQALRKAGLV